MTIILMIPR